mmetsp:Transcript_29429/g.28154  ORF Transcript_29429/g.28154 Transcript_29429/m.28154 type:complete len:302 (-) Transcript_29429:97-1002(-)
MLMKSKTTSRRTLNSISANISSSACRSKQQTEVIRTTVPTIYTATPLTPEYLDISRWQKDAKEIFNYPTKFCVPAEFNYEYPSNNVPEFAFVGRSNVGKSSLISRLVKDNKLVRISKQPGCTKSVNYFAFIKGKNTHITYMVDLPGYGFATTSKTEKQKWQAFIEGYLRGRDQITLRRVYVLIDSRHGLKPLDLEMMKLLDDCILPYQVILTKADAASESEKKHALNSVFEVLMNRPKSSNVPFVHLLSSRSGEGLDHLECDMAEVMSHKMVGQSKMNESFITDILKNQSIPSEEEDIEYR